VRAHAPVLTKVGTGFFVRPLLVFLHWETYSSQGDSRVPQICAQSSAQMLIFQVLSWQVTGFASESWDPDFKRLGMKVWRSRSEEQIWHKTQMLRVRHPSPGEVAQPLCLSKHEDSPSLQNCGFCTMLWSLGHFSISWPHPHPRAGSPIRGSVVAPAPQ
jgi:hypothetical protein